MRIRRHRPTRPATDHPSTTLAALLAALCLGGLCLGALAGCTGPTPPPASAPAAATARAEPAAAPAPDAAMFRISDVHFDPFFGCSDDPATCRQLFDRLFDAQTGRWQPGTSWDAVFSTFCGQHPQYPQCEFQLAGHDRDTNYYVFDGAMKAAAQTAAATSPKPAFVLYTGDFLAHEFRSRYCCTVGRCSCDQRGERCDGSGGSCRCNESGSCPSDEQCTCSGGGGCSCDSDGKSRCDEALFDDFVDQTLLFVASKMQAALGLPVYAALGNNDAYCGDYRMLPGSGFLAHSARTWAQHFAPFQAGQESHFEKGGYYRVDLQPRHRILVLNTVIYTTNAQGGSSYFTIECDLPQAHHDGFDAGTFDVSQPPWAGLSGAALQAKLRTETDARGNLWIDTQFGWLVDELVDAQASGEAAWLAAHVPPGLNGFDSGLEPFLAADANQDFAQLLSDRRFAPAIAGVLAAHTHENEFKVSRTDFRQRAAGFVLISPAIDSDHGNQPAFQIHCYDPRNLGILDYKTYSTVDGTSWPATANFQDLYGWAIYQYIVSGRCVAGGPGPQAPSKLSWVGVNRASLSELFEAMLDDCDQVREKYACSYVSLPFPASAGERAGCLSHLPCWCVGCDGCDPSGQSGCDAGQSTKAHQVSLPDLLGTFPHACRPCCPPPSP